MRFFDQSTLFLYHGREFHLLNPIFYLAILLSIGTSCCLVDCIIWRFVCLANGGAVCVFNRRSSYLSKGLSSLLVDGCTRCLSCRLIAGCTCCLLDSLFSLFISLIDTLCGAVPHLKSLLHKCFYMFILFYSKSQLLK